MKLHIDQKLWGVEEVTGLKGADFSVAAKFTELKPGRVLVFPLVSENNEIWQVEKDEFMLLSGHELFHVRVSAKTGAEILFRAPAENAKGLFNKAFFYYEDSSSNAHIYSVFNRLTIRDVLRKIIDPGVSVVIEKTSENQTVLVRIDAPYLSAHFLLEGAPLQLRLFDSTSSHIKTFNGFVALAKERCNEVKIAEYYEKCGGYLIDGLNAIGIFSQRFYGDSIAYEFASEDYFSKVAIPRLLMANNLVEVVPKKLCSFLGKTVDTPEYSIGLSSDVLIITEHTDSGDRSYALEMYGETCLGVRQTGERDFLAITTKNPSTPLTEIKRIIKHGAADKYVWDRLPCSSGERDSTASIFCQLTNDIILYEEGVNDHPGCHHFEMWSISKKHLVNVIDSFYDLCWSTNEAFICHMAKQILVRPMGEKNIDKDPQVMIALRLYQPKQYCDVYALINPSKKYRVHGKAFNMLADSMTSKPRTVRGLVKIFKDNMSLKKKYSL